MVYRAESGAKRTSPEQRKPIDTFEIEDENLDVDRARDKAREMVRERHGQDGSVLVLVGGGLSVTLRARV